MILSQSPYTGKTAASYNYHSDENLSHMVGQVHASYDRYRLYSLENRRKVLRQMASSLRANKYHLAELITLEMGKLVSESLSEIEKCAWVCDYYAEYGESFLQDEIISTDATYSGISYQPLGVIMCIMPWNFPFWQVFRFAAPALMAGNTFILKHSSQVPRCALEIEQIIHEAHQPFPLIQNIFASKEQISDLIADRRISAVTLTGSESAGRSVATQAGRYLKKCVLELGGSDPYIVLRDADVKAAAETCVKGRMLNAGQSCIGAKRFIVENGAYEEFMHHFREELDQYSFGDPMNNKTTLAPLVSFDQREELHKQVLDAVGNGAHLMIGGYVPDEIEGAFYPPTILTEVDRDNPVYFQELFGPVAMIFHAKDEDHAIQLANDTPFGLGAAIFSQNEAKAQRIAELHLHAGSCFINDQVKSDPRLPFGGIKQSGYGRELSHFGIREFTNVKTIYRK